MVEKSLTPVDPERPLPNWSSIKLSNPGQMVLIPKLGQHNEEILQAAGYSPEEIEQLRRKKVI